MDDELDPTPPIVVTAIAASVAPLPFLAVYSVLFIVHGSVHPVIPPDITNTQHGELAAGLFAFALFIVFLVSVLWLLNRKRRWLLVICQAATLVTSADFVFDSTTGSPAVPAVLLVCSAVSLVTALMPQTARHVHSWLGGRQRARQARGSDRLA